MATDMFLAMTAAEIAKTEKFPAHFAWMACHFSPYSTGLSNLPRELASGAFLILNDLTPIHGHDPQRIAMELTACIEDFSCCGLLLDFQRAGYPEIPLLIKTLLQDLPCPVVVSDVYAQGFDCPVFLSPVPPSCSLENHINPWKEREIWLEIGMDGEEILLTETGVTVTSLPRFAIPEEGFQEESLHCHYAIEINQNVRFNLWRTREDLMALMAEARNNGIAGMVGLYQELNGILLQDL